VLKPFLKSGEGMKESSGGGKKKERNKNNSEKNLT
jgi:hypothetical protein